MRIPFGLALRHIRVHWFRNLLTVGAVAVAAFLFCFLVSIVDSLEGQIEDSSQSRVIVQSSVSLFVDLPLEYQAKIAATFHDIGKTKKPEYFTENQRERANPHDENNPSLSALIIKAHVKDGIDLAVKHKLPRAVLDVIQQHHGTSLIRYFFQRALSDKRPAQLPPGGTRPASTDTRPPFQSLPGLEPARVCETTYRYDGPRPQFKESAIIHLADGVEAASRSLRKVTPQHLGELIDQIFKDRIEDGQLDEAPLTFEELNKIKSSFTFTLLNMLHSRVSYTPQGEEHPAPKAAQPAT